MNLQNLIKDKLLETRRCKYKDSHIPKGWTEVHIDTFSKELAKEIKSKFYGILREPRRESK